MLNRENGKNKNKERKKHEKIYFSNDGNFDDFCYRTYKRWL